MADRSLSENRPAYGEAGTTERAALIAETANSLSILNRLGCEIVRGAFPPDTRLPDEPSMLKRYSISRTALREAYSKLAAKGMIVARPKVGTSVRPPAFWNMLDPDVLSWHLQTKPAEEIARDLFALRRMVEPAAAEAAAHQRSEAELQRMTDAFEDMQAAVQMEQELVEADLRYHLEILFATHNHFIGAFSALIHAAMLTTFAHSWRAAKTTEIKYRRLAQHGDVLNAIRDGDGARARRCMEVLLHESLLDMNDRLKLDEQAPARRGQN